MHCLCLILCVESALASSISRHVPSKLLMISLDGFRWDYLHRAQLKLGNFTKLIDEGVRAKWMTNQFQTKTFPNHWTMVTGLYEEAHGIVANKFYDPEQDCHFDYTNATTWNDKPDFWGGEPLWITNQKNGGKSACEFWVGSEVHNKTPTYYGIYDDKKPFNDRVDTIVDWLSIEDVNLGLLYIEEPDHTGHKFGPDSDEVNQMLEKLNDVIGYLISELKRKNLYETMNIILTSDHGMAELSKDRLILLDQIEGFEDMIDTERTFFYDTNAAIQPKSDDVKEELYQKLKGLNDPHMRVWKKEEIPEHLHYSNNDRITDIFLNADNRWDIKKSMASWEEFHLKGQHGYAPDVDDMHPIFLARGPDFANRPNELPPFSNIDLYSLTCHLLQLTPAPNNGSLTPLQPYLAQPLDLALPIAMGVLFSVFILMVLIYAIYTQFWKWNPVTLINSDQGHTNIQYQGL